MTPTPLTKNRNRIPFNNLQILMALGVAILLSVMVGLLGFASIRSIQGQVEHLLSSSRSQAGDETICIREKDANQLEARLRSSSRIILTATIISVIMGVLMSTIVAQKIGLRQNTPGENDPIHPS